MRFWKKLALILTVILCFTSCSKQAESGRFFLDNNIYWAVAPGTTPLSNVAKLNFKKLDDFKGNNLERIVGREGSYIWLKIEFDIPEYLKYKALGFVIPYLHFSESAYLNGSFIGSYGSFPPNEYSAQYNAHFYYLPSENINWNNENTILLKVWAHGRATISDGCFIAPYTNAKNRASTIDFLNSRIYLLFESALFMAFLLFLLASIGFGKRGMHLLIFAILNLYTMFFVAYFFAPEVPWYQSYNISYLLITKLLLCTPAYWIIFLIASLVLAMQDITEPKPLLIVRNVITMGLTAVTMFIPSYNLLMKLCPYFLALVSINAVVAIVYLVFGFMDSERRLQAFTVLACFLPFIISAVADILCRDVLKIVDHPYYAVYGWFLSIVAFVVVLMSQYRMIRRQFERLSKSLAEEVELKTVDLTFANEKLEHDKRNSELDMDMASIVQKKFFPPTEVFMDGWELAVCYEPMNKISGDLYDYYADESKLSGIGLFDASGHGVSASLVVMLAKSIIYRCFAHAVRRNQTLSTALEEVNDRLIEEKGEVQNYMTGILFRINPFDENDHCVLELASAGHPYPLYYSASKDHLVPVMHDELQEQYGALGIKGVDVSFPNVDLDIGVGDIIVCFTDGLTEAVNEDMEEFGLEEIKKILMDYNDEPASEIRNKIKKAVFNHIEENPRNDDITFIVIKRVPRWQRI